LLIVEPFSAKQRHLSEAHVRSHFHTVPNGKWR
jgi:hypothetical protein